jgi:type I restriction enzyme S subunit
MSEWTPVTLAEEIELAYGKSLPARMRQPGSFEVFGSNGRVGHHTEPLIQGPGIIVGRKGSVGEVVYSARDFWPIDTTYYVVNKGRHDWRFIYHLLSSLRLTELNSHSAVPGLNREDVYSIAVKLPPKHEQERIALSLDAVQNSIGLESKAIQLSQELKRAAMRELFTRGLRGEPQKETEIGPVPESWQRMPISGLGNVVTGNTPPTKDAANYAGGEIPFVAPGDIEHGARIETTEKLITDQGLSRSRRITAGTTCFVCIGSTIGKVGYATASVCATNQQINSILPSADFDPLFVFYLMTFWADRVRQEASPSPVPILSKGAFEQIEIFASTDPDEQREIAQILDAIDRKIDLHRSKRAILAELFGALLNKLMTGEIRVADLDLSALVARDDADVAPAGPQAEAAQ